MASVGHAVADWVAAMWALALVAVAWLASVVVARHSGRVAERRDIDEGRARVRAQMEAAAAETIALPRQREAADS